MTHLPDCPHCQTLRKMNNALAARLGQEQLRRKKLAHEYGNLLRQLERLEARLVERAGVCVNEDVVGLA